MVGAPEQETDPKTAPDTIKEPVTAPAPPAVKEPVTIAASATVNESGTGTAATSVNESETGTATASINESETGTATTTIRDFEEERTNFQPDELLLARLEFFDGRHVFFTKESLKKPEKELFPSQFLNYPH